MRWFLKLLWDDFSIAPISGTLAIVLVVISLIQPDPHRADHALIVAFIVMLSRQMYKDRLERNKSA